MLSTGQNLIEKLGQASAKFNNQAAYHMPAEEYEAVARDLPVVLQGLRDYPKERFAPPIDETNWRY